MSKQDPIDTNESHGPKEALPVESEQERVEHELANLLTAIALYSEQGMSRLEKDDPLYEDLKQIFLASEKAVALTQK